MRSRLYERLSSLALPLGSLVCREADVCPAGTDGEAALFAPDFLRREFLTGSRLSEELTLHLLLHLMLGHPRSRGERDRACWDAACDLAVLLMRHARLPQEAESHAAFSARCKLQAHGAGHAEEIFAYLYAEPELLSPEELRNGTLDDHSLWEAFPSAKHARHAADGGGTGFQALGRLLPQPLPEKPVIAAKRLAQSFRSNRIHAKAHRLPRSCANCLKRARTGMYPATNFNTPDISTDWSVTAACRSSSRWNTRRSAVCVSSLVIDTSASCSRTLCADFLGELAGLLARENLFFERFNLHVIECDCEVQQDTRLTTLEELSGWLQTMTLHGGGGTDFRPAFRHIDGLVETGEFAHLQGILYFTDGYGVFLASPPAYRAIFVMLQYRYDDIDLPPWVEKLVLAAEKPKGDEAWILSQAKQELRQTVRAYTAKTGDGLYRMPREKQRPGLLMGPPGIGKTAILTQLAQEEHIGLVSYTMAHHTRQSALGLPVIVERTAAGRQYRATAYTMSEIIAAVYEQMEKTGLHEGILFLDEINCVSETLMPAILQML